VGKIARRRARTCLGFAGRFCPRRPPPTAWARSPERAAQVQVPRPGDLAHSTDLRTAEFPGPDGLRPPRSWP